MSKQLDYFAANFAGLSVFVLSCGISIGFVGLLLMGAFMHEGRPISEQGASMLSAIGGAMVGAIATYVGHAAGHMERQREAREEASTEDTTKEATK